MRACDAVERVSLISYRVKNVLPFTCAFNFAANTFVSHSECAFYLLPQATPRNNSETISRLAKFESATEI